MSREFSPVPGEESKFRLSIDWLELGKESDDAMLPQQFDEHYLGNDIHGPKKMDEDDCFPCDSTQRFHHIDVSKHTLFLSFKYETVIICYQFAHFETKEKKEKTQRKQQYEPVPNDLIILN